MTTVPISGTDIRLLSGVPFSNDYKHTRWFDTVDQQANYFNGRPATHVMDEANFQRIEGKLFVACNKSIDDLWNVCYLMFRNTSYNNKWFYAFVTKLEYVQKNTTYVHFEIDVLQTWRFQFNFKPSFVIREHCPLWNSDGSPVINTVDEGLDYGTEYDIVGFDDFPPKGYTYWLVIVAKSLLHGNGGSETGTGEETEKTNNIKATNIGSPQPLSYYVHPFKLDGSTPTVSIGGASKQISPINTVLSNIYSNEDAVNNIVSLYVTQHIGVDAVENGTGSVSLSGNNFSLAMLADGESQNMQTIYVEQLASFESSLSESIAKYDKFTKPTESKLLMYPYSFAEMTDLAGNSFPIKLEYVNSSRLQTIIKGSLGVSSKVAYQLDGYNLSSNSNLSENEKGRIGIQNGFINNNPQDVPIITDMLSAYLQGNRNSLQNQENSIMFNGAMNVASSAISGATTGSVGGAVMGAVGGLGNSVLQLQGLQAKKQDISNLPPTLAKMGSNTAFDFGYYNSGFFIVKKQIKSEYRQRLNDFFKAFGYKVNRLKTPNFHTRNSWNYIQTLECNLTGNFGVEDLQKLKNIFNNGVTLWHTNDVGNYDLSNGVI